MIFESSYMPDLLKTFIILQPTRKTGKDTRGDLFLNLSHVIATVTFQETEIKRRSVFGRPQTVTTRMFWFFCCFTARTPCFCRVRSCVSNPKQSSLVRARPCVCVRKCEDHQFVICLLCSPSAGQIRQRILFYLNI